MGDYAAGDSSTTWNVAFTPTGHGRIRNALESAGDVDWHRIHMRANTLYQLDVSQKDFSIVRPNGAVANYSSLIANTKYFYAAEEGDYYLVVGKSDSEAASFYANLVEGALRPVKSNGSVWPSEYGSLSSFTLMSSYSEIDVFSRTTLVYEDGDSTIEVPANTPTTLNYTNFQTLKPAADFVGPSEMYFRGRLFSNRDLYTPWGNIELYGAPYQTSLFDDTARPPLFLSYSFATATPDYFLMDPEVGNFHSMSEDAKAQFRTAFKRWDDALNNIIYSEADPGATNGDADTMVFFAELNTETLVYRYGSDAGGDIVLNVNSPVFADLSEGSQGFFEVLRAIGTTLGMNETTEFNRSETVMGRRTGSDVDGLPFTSFPTPLDIHTGRYPNSTFPHYGIVPGSTTFYLNSDVPFQKTVVDAGNVETISAEGVNFSVSIDLRPGQSSRIGNSDQFVWMNSYLSLLTDGIGSLYSDGLVGNHLSNRLYGNAGRDVLIGGVGNDFLDGGLHGDYYIFRPGFGNDTISEIGGSGLDVVRVEGLFNLNSLSDDVTFQRDSDDLIIRFELDNLANYNADSIRIQNMSQMDSRIESLSLLNETGIISKISLPALFAQTDESRRRFQIAPGNDSFGQLVAPV
ncbi:MAG: hypothetical protein R3C03_04640 [Pirellulaceae bacterium]